MRRAAKTARRPEPCPAQVGIAVLEGGRVIGADDIDERPKRMEQPMKHRIDIVSAAMPIGAAASPGRRLPCASKTGRE